MGALLLYLIYVIEWNNEDVEILQLKDVLDFTPRGTRSPRANFLPRATTSLILRPNEIAHHRERTNTDLYALRPL
jgi:hypothetical protein